MHKTPKYSIGIDLGTSNSVCAYHENSRSKDISASILNFTQLLDDETISENNSLPSFCYCFGLDQVESIAPEVIHKLPSWYQSSSSTGETISSQSSSINYISSKWIPGQIAKNYASRSPERVIHSAKSWLSLSNIDQASRILPWNQEFPEEFKLSPVQVQEMYLRYIKSSWEFQLGQNFSSQNIVITIPASFSEEASFLTKKAALDAGYPESTQFLDEPQAALYAHMQEIEKAFSNEKNARPIILICDIGGGTTDFSLFAFSKDSNIPFERIKVGSHLILGGDNIDLAISHFIVEKHNLHLSNEEFSLLNQESRFLKERYFGNSGLTSNIRISIAPRKRSLFSSSKTFDINVAELLSFVSTGFFPLDVETKLPEVAADTGIEEFGLPLEKNPSITSHLKSFIEGVHIDAILFNGGTMLCPVFRDRIISFITKENETKQKSTSQLFSRNSIPREITSKDLSTSVAIGACSYLTSKLENTHKVKAGYPRNIFLIVKDKDEKSKAVCILTIGEESEEWLPIREFIFSLDLNSECSFSLVSNQDRTVKLGEVKWLDSSFTPLSTIETSLNAAGHKENTVDVILEVRIRSLRTIELRLKSNNDDAEVGIWPLAFNFSGSTKKAPALLNPGTTENYIIPKNVKIILLESFGKAQKESNKEGVTNIIRDIEKTLGSSKTNWTPAILRGICDILIPLSSKRARSLLHETTWLQIVGYCLRPGFGFEGDEERIELLRETYRLSLFFKKEKLARTQWCIFWRRIAPGLPEDIQRAIFDAEFNLLKNNKFSDPESIRLISSLELVQIENKKQLLDSLFKLIEKQKKPSEALLWAFSRLLSRYSSRDDDTILLPNDIVSEYIEKALSLALEKNAQVYLLHLLTSSQEPRNDDFDIPLHLREKLLRIAVKSGIKIGRQGFSKSAIDSALFGESLPIGIRIKERKS